MKRFEILNYLIKKYDYKQYLEIGIDTGETWFKINTPYKTGADPKSKIFDRAVHLKTSDDFFAQNKRMFDIIFIDGLHEYKQVKKDIENSLKFLLDGGCIVIHDANPKTEQSQKVPREVKNWNGDVWKAITDYRKNGKLGLITVDTDEGISIITNKIKIKKLNSKSPLTYSNFDKNRVNWLNLVSLDEFKEIL